MLVVPLSVSEDCLVVAFLSGVVVAVFVIVEFLLVSAGLLVDVLSRSVKKDFMKKKAIIGPL